MLIDFYYEKCLNFSFFNFVYDLIFFSLQTIRNYVMNEHSMFLMSRIGTGNNYDFLFSWFALLDSFL
jgi:hypothetical protein